MNKKMEKIVPVITIILMIALVIFYLDKTKINEKIDLKFSEDQIIK